MFVLKNSYYLYIENSKILNLNLIKLKNKFTVIYRNIEKTENIANLLKFRRECKRKYIKFYVANDLNLLQKLKGDGLYLSAYNKSLKHLSRKKTIKNIIGSAHNNKEIYMKLKQGCKQIVFSRLFETSYKDKKGHVGIIKFNLLNNYIQCLIPLGGIKRQNLLKLNLITARSFAILSEIKKKPAQIISRLF